MSPSPPPTQAGSACSSWTPGCACCPLEACTAGAAPLRPAPLRQRATLRPATFASGAALRRPAVSRSRRPPRSSSRIRRSTIAAGRRRPESAAAALCMRADHGSARRWRQAQRPQQTLAPLELPSCDGASTTSPARAGKQRVCECKINATVRSGRARFGCAWLQAVWQLGARAPAVQRWRSELRHWWLLHQRRSLGLPVAGCWIPASAHQQPPQRRGPPPPGPTQRRCPTSDDDG